MSNDHTIGYKKPPLTAQFKKGKSGNPKGRPKGSRNLRTDLEAELAETIQVSEGGTRKAISKQRAMLKSLTARALQGDTRAANTVLGLVQKLLDDEEPGASQEELAAEDRAILDAYEQRLRQRFMAETKEADDEQEDD
jgi:hypothetical protein